MRRRTAALLAAGTLSLTVFAQRAWREYPAFEYNDFPIPPDYQEKTEYVFARLMYPNAAFSTGGFRRFRNFGGGRGAFWTMDYPRSKRHFSLAPRGLTNISVQAVEQPINLEEHDQYDWPW